VQTIIVAVVSRCLSWRFQVAAGGALGGHWIGFIISQVIQSDKYFDITEDVTLLAVLCYIYQSIEGNPSIRQQIVFGFALLWCVRLCAFVGYRVIIRGSDWRFDKLITSTSYNLFGWTSGGTWCFFNCFCLWMIADCPGGVHEDNHSSFTFLDIVGIIIFIIGFTVEIVSDIQKYKFNAKYSSGSNSKWIETGLWAYSRHPNYAGEISLWVGIALICCGENISAFGVFASVVTPVWSLFFLVFTSLMLLEKRADLKWGNLKAYNDYKRNTPVLFPGV
jgi:steroid 5-alpha reductase family enzyme